MDSSQIPSRNLVTGGAGSVGTHLVSALLAMCEDVRITVVDDFSSGATGPPLEDQRVRVIRGDVASAEVLAEAFADSPAWVFHLAALFVNQNSVEHPEQTSTPTGSDNDSS